MSIFISRKNKMRCPECGGFDDKRNGLSFCLRCGCDLIPEDEYQSGYYQMQRSIVECPYCHSKNTTKISKASKAVDAALFGVFSVSKNSKQWHCNNCKSDF